MLFRSGKPPEPDVLAELLDFRCRSFVNVVHAGDEVAEVLSQLKRRYRLGLLSNYPDGTAVRASLEKLGLTRFFDSIVVSGELGYVKPHPLTFDTSLRELGVPAERALFAGDHWLADIQGAKRAGMQAVWMRRWAPLDEVAPRPGDFGPDATLAHLDELPVLLGIAKEDKDACICNAQSAGS